MRPADALDAARDTVHALRVAWQPRRLLALAGTAAVDGCPLHVVTDLDGEALRYWRALLFDGPLTIEPLGLERVTARLGWHRDADLAIMTHHRLFRGRGRRAGWLTVPSWLDTGIPLAATVEETLRAHPAGHRSRQSDVRRIRRAGFQPAIVRGAAAVREFLDEWYLPYVHARWGDACVDIAPDSRRRAERDGEVLWVMQGERPAAGVLLEAEGAELRMVTIGMRDAAWQREGALAATYYFSIAEAVRRGCAWLRTGGTRPTLSDGVLSFKRKWGARVRPVRQQNYLAFSCGGWTPTLRALFARHPLVAEAEDGEFLACTDAFALLRPRDDAAGLMFQLGGLAGALVPAEDGGWARVPLPGRTTRRLERRPAAAAVPLAAPTPAG